MHIEPFQPKHLETLVLQESQAGFSRFFDDQEYAPALINAGPCFAATENGVVYACAGIVHQWDNRAIAWGLIGEAAGSHFVKIHRAVRRFLDMSPVRRVEAFVDADFDAGHRWIQMLGFEREGFMRAFTPLGKDAVLYARIR